MCPREITHRAHDTALAVRCLAALALARSWRYLRPRHVPGKQPAPQRAQAHPSATRRRALELLAASPNGATEALMRNFNSGLAQNSCTHGTQIVPRSETSALHACASMQV